MSITTGLLISRARETSMTSKERRKVVVGASHHHMQLSPAVAMLAFVARATSVPNASAKGRKLQQSHEHVHTENKVEQPSCPACSDSPGRVRAFLRVGPGTQQMVRNRKKHTRCAPQGPSLFFSPRYPPAAPSPLSYRTDTLAVDGIGKEQQKKQRQRGGRSCSTSHSPTRVQKRDESAVLSEI
jgi:hypothetical protein